jgi:hypothetical protein
VRKENRGHAQDHAHRESKKHDDCEFQGTQLNPPD